MSTSHIVPEGREADLSTENWCDVCSASTSFVHDHRPDNSGLDDGPWLPGQQPRKKPAPKSPDEMAAIRAKAWATRRKALGNNTSAR